MSQKSEASTAGIITKGDGDHFIPASTRPDGSLRKEIKIRPGYKPPEDVKVYKNQIAEAWKSSGSRGVPGAEAVDEGTSGQVMSKASNKNAKRREARKKAKANQSTDQGTGNTATPGLVDRGVAKDRVPASSNGDPSTMKKRNGAPALDGRRQRSSRSSSRSRRNRTHSNHRVDPISPAVANTPFQSSSTQPRSHTFFDDSPTSTLHYSPKAVPRSDQGLESLSPSDLSQLSGDPAPIPRKPPPPIPNPYVESTNASIQSQRKLAGFFGDEFLGKSSPGSVSETASERTQKGRKQSIGSSFRKPSNAGSNGTQGSAPRSSISNSRPRSPVAAPTSDVTPWAYQEFQDISQHGNAPVRAQPTGPDKLRYTPSQADLRHSSHDESVSLAQRLHLPGHRHKRSKDNAAAATARSVDRLLSNKPPPLDRDDSLNSMKSYQLPSSAPPRSPSPTISPNTNGPMSTPMPPNRTQQKGSIFSKLKRHAPGKHKHETGKGKREGEQSFSEPVRGASDSKPIKSAQRRVSPGPAPPQSKSLSHEGKNFLDKTRLASVASMKMVDSRVREDSVTAATIGSYVPSAAGFGFNHNSKEAKALKARIKANKHMTEGSNVFNLDTDLDNMEGIISGSTPLFTPPEGGGGIFAGEEFHRKVSDNNEGDTWEVPDSWAVKRIEDDNLARLGEMDEDGFLPAKEDSGMPYFIRVFRQDGTFATISTKLNTTVAEVLSLLGRKSFLQDHLENYNIILRKHDLQRILKPMDRPLAIQKRLLELAGYTSRDHLDEVGREDNSYLCRFTFLPSKLTGFSLEGDATFNRMQKFSHIDLSARNLVTIPIALYQKASEIISIDLSRNLSLDIPKDFIENCINLRDIKFMSNEAWKLPLSISLANRLTYLDFSNNQIEQIDNAGLDRLPNLVSLKMANNKLRSLPTYFSQFKMLRNFYASNNNFDHFPLCLCEMTSMVDLDLSWNAIQEIPPELAQLTNLCRLTITNNKLSGSLPAFSSSLAALREIDIRYNKLSNVDGICRIPKLETVWCTHNKVSAFEGSFHKLQKMNMDFNPVTRFTAVANMLTLINLDLSSAKLAQLPDSLYEKMPNLITLVLDKNHFTTLPPQIGRLQKLQTLSIARNNLSSLPAEVGCLQELTKLDLRENNLTKVPPEIWFASRLEVLNLSSNVLESFVGPKPGAPPPNIPFMPETPAYEVPGMISHSPSWDEFGKLDKFGARRPSQSTGFPFTGSSGGASPSARKNSNVSVATPPSARKQSVVPKSSNSTLVSQSTALRKDSTISGRTITFASTLRELVLADNRLDDDVFNELRQFPELRMLNISWNAIYDMPPGIFSRWPLMEELYLSGNELSSLPSDDMEHMSSLRTLHLNGNKMQTLPSELGSIAPLAVLDVGSNALKYNVNNWPYDWNWNFNANLRYLNFSGNRRLEIKPRSSYGSSLIADDRDLTDFTGLQNLKILGLMDVTVLNPLVPEQSEDRRVRTSGSLAGTLNYGMADTLGSNESLLTIDMIVPRFRGHEDELLMGLFDGTKAVSGGSKLAKYCHEYFKPCLQTELDQLDRDVETPVDAIRRAFLNLNKELAIIASGSKEQKIRLPPKAHRGAITTTPLSREDLETGSAATVIYIEGTQLYAANIGDAQALLIQGDGGFRSITDVDDPAKAEERQRIREAGGFVDIKGKMSGGYTSKYGQPEQLIDVSRAFGYIQHMPSCIAAPHVQSITISDRDELIIVATKEVWSLISPEVVMDIARSESSDLMRAAQKIRDLAIAFGARSRPKLTVMILSVSDLRKSSKGRGRTATLSMGPTGSALDETLFRTTTRRPRGARGETQPDDSNLARLGQEVEPPTGEVALVFTDIKNSTLLWETFPLAMRSAIKVHNNIMRRQLRIIGGYEVKTEGDAFMVCFPTATSALLWCFSVQSLLLDAPWPSEVLESVHGEEVHDGDGNLLFRGLSVRMGVHWGIPVCEPDPITRRMDYFGPMVNKSSRISAVADGGQIAISADALSEIHRCMHTYQEDEREGDDDESQYDAADGSDPFKESIRRDLQNLQSQGYEVKELGLRNLKGLENPELIFLVYPHVLVGRLAMQQHRDEAMALAARKGIEEQIAEGDLERTESKIQRAYPEALSRAGVGIIPGKPVRERITGNTAGDIRSGVATASGAGSETEMDSDTIFSLLHVATRLEHLLGSLNHPELRSPGRHGRRPGYHHAISQLLEPPAADPGTATSSTSSLISKSSYTSYGSIPLKPVDEALVNWLRQQGENVNEQAMGHLLENLVHRIESAIGGLYLRHLLNGANDGHGGNPLPGALDNRGGIWDLLDRVGEHIEASGLSGGLGTPGFRTPR